MSKELEMLEKIDKYVTIYDFYKNLLTEKQCSYFEAYYFDNMSLQEIASFYSVSRNAIFDQIQKTIKLLDDYEAKLGLVSLFEKRNEVYEKYLGKTKRNKEIESLILELKELE